MVLENGKIINLMKSKILPIAGDASFRTFYRLVLNKTSKIIVLAKKEKYKNLIAYSTINKFLRSNKILTPKLYTHNYPKGLIIIEDFGDLSFYKILLKKKQTTKLQKTYRFTLKNSKNMLKIFLMYWLCRLGPGRITRS